MNDFKHPLNTGLPLVGHAVTKDATPKSLEQHWDFVPATKKELKAVAKELGLEDVPKGYIAGYASTTSLDLHRDVVLAGAFDDSIKARGLSGPHGVKLLLGHDPNKLAGEIRVLETRGDKLWIEAQLELDISYVKDAYRAAKIAGGVSFSVGFRLQDYEFKENESGDFEYLEIKRGDLFEVSVVTFAAQPEAVMTYIKNVSDFNEFKNLPDLAKALGAGQVVVKGRNMADALIKCVNRLSLPKKETHGVTEYQPDYSAAIALAKSINLKPQSE